MKTHELFESAQLDALGLLDEREQMEFEAAFRNASPAIREQIREEQDRFARPDRFRLNAEAPADLRSRVLSAVKAEIAGAAGSVRKIHSAGRDLPMVHPVRRVSPVWRVATLACATAAVVLGVLVMQQNAQMTGFQVASGNDRTIDKLVEMFGPADLTDAVFGSGTKKMPFAAAQADFKGQASIWYNAEAQSARLFCRNIITKPNESVRLVALDDSGNVTHVIAEFGSSGELITKKVAMAGFNPKQLAIYVASKDAAPGDGRRIMVSASV